jgi:hypothetical protein
MINKLDIVNITLQINFYKKHQKILEKSLNILIKIKIGKFLKNNYLNLNQKILIHS